MSRRPLLTPCPAQYNLPRQSSFFDDSAFAAGDDTTRNIEFTSAFPKPQPAGLKSAKPRRRPATGKLLDFAIHEDVIAHGIAGAPGLKAGAQKSAISQPPQRAKRNVGWAPVQTTANTSVQVIETATTEHDSAVPCAMGKARRMSQAPKRPPPIIPGGNPTAMINHLSPLLEDTVYLPMNDPTMILKPARRGTIYIPTEDTTMPSMYMDIFSPIKNFDINARSSSPAPASADQTGAEATGIAAQMLAKKSRKPARHSMITLSPKRGPLKVTMRSSQEQAVIEDRWGQGGGKENVPPGLDEKLVGVKLTSSLKSSPHETKAQESVSSTRPSRVTSTKSGVSRLYEPTASSTARLYAKKGTERGSVKTGWNSGIRTNVGQSVPTASEVLARRNLVKTAEIEEDTPPKIKAVIPSRFVVPRLESVSVNEAYPLLTEDLANSSMYEDDWLSHQEIAITQLVNCLFAPSSQSTDASNVGMRRFRLVEMYNAPANALLNKRLQAALLYGSLSAPSDVLRRMTQLSSDLGRRKAFTDLWLDTYKLAHLQPALEVVVGRQCTAYSPESSPSREDIEPRPSTARKTLQRFIETFLIRNEDSRLDRPQSEHNAWTYQRTMLRSLMLIRLLDSTKTSGRKLGSSCLFQFCSPHKATVAVVRALFQLLNPSAGDPIRSLNHVGYTVSHAQYPLEEYSYQIDNLAVDLRDGVRVTRLVELLLYPSAPAALDQIHDSDATTTICLPTGDTLSLVEGQRDWPLSQHLKFPCIGRATKLYNVELALSALRGVKGMQVLTQDIRAEDVVDGFREKTVKLLWGLTSKWGLGGLIDWNDTEREIRRLCRENGAGHDNDYFDMVDDEEGYIRQKLLLKSWAQALAAKKGLTVKNLTTSFADGRVFEAIVDEYDKYISPTTHIQPGSLAGRLRRLGCSEQFAMLFSTPTPASRHPHLFDRDFVVAALAFLCSRLLGPSRAVRAAMTIQKNWRAYWQRVVEAQKVQLKIVANDCAKSVQSREVRMEYTPEQDLGSEESSTGAVSRFAGMDVVSPAKTEDGDIWLGL